MSAGRLSMRKLREILRLHYDKALSQRAIAASCAVASRSVAAYLARARVAKVTWASAVHVRGASIKQVSVWLGDAEIATTERYIPATRSAFRPGIGAEQPPSQVCHPHVSVLRDAREVEPLAVGGNGDPLEEFGSQRPDVLIVRTRRGRP